MLSNTILSDTKLTDTLFNLLRAETKARKDKKVYFKKRIEAHIETLDILVMLLHTLRFLATPILKNFVVYTDALERG